MVGLQGSGKTTTTAKLAKRLKERNGKRVLLASLDTNRPAAMEQLAILAAQIGVDSLPIVKGETAVQIAKRAKTQAAMGGYDVVFFDTAGRLHIDEVLMDEVQAVRDIAQPREMLLVVDGLTGQDAVNVASEFDGKVGITGVVLTRMDGDGRGGAALSMRAVTGKPIRFVGLGEKMDALETFEAERVAGRILGMGDIVALVEKARETFEAEQAERMAKRFAKGLFNMNDLKSQLEQMLKMGGMQAIMGMMPGMGGMAKAAEKAGFDDKMLHRQIALINSMTKKERANPDLLAASRKKRIAAGARAGGVRSEQAAETAPADGRHDEEDGQGWHDEAGHQADDGQGRTGRRAGRPQEHGPRPTGSRRPRDEAGHWWWHGGDAGHGQGSGPARRAVGDVQEEMSPAESSCSAHRINLGIGKFVGRADAVSRVLWPRLVPQIAELRGHEISPLQPVLRKPCAPAYRAPAAPWCSGSWGGFALGLSRPRLLLGPTGGLGASRKPVGGDSFTTIVTAPNWPFWMDGTKVCSISSPRSGRKRKVTFPSPSMKRAARAGHFARSMVLSAPRFMWCVVAFDLVRVQPVSAAHLSGAQHDPADP